MVCASTEKAEKIVGGFIPIPVAGLLYAWRSCRQSSLKTADFRTWLACHEMVARRCHVHRDRDRSPFYRVAELARLTGTSERRARASIRRLVAAGLLEWSDEAIGFPEVLIQNDEQSEELDAIGAGRGSLAIPRRMLRYLVDGATTAMIATVLAILLRCLSRRKGGWDGRGRVKASWIARTFGVSIPAVKVARRELIDLGWITAEDSDQWAMNRWGRAYRIDLGWEAPTSGRADGPVKGACEAPFPPQVKGEPDTPLPHHGKGGPIPPFTGPESIPPRPDPGAVPIPPDLQTGNPSGRIQNQEPVPEQTGFSIEDSGQGREPGGRRGVSESDQQVTPKTTPPGRPSSVDPLPAPKLADVRVDDLKDTSRLLDLLRQAIAKGLVTPSEADRLRFIGAAEHALAIASNPAALFAWLVLNGCWRYITAEDEDRANVRIKAHLRGPEPVPVATSPRVFTAGIPIPASSPPRVRTFCVPLASSSRPNEPGGLSEDARIVGEVREATIRAGIFRDPWPAFQARYPEWTRVRWDVALMELGLV